MSFTQAGVAAPPGERLGMLGPGLYGRLTPAVSWSWNMEGRASRRRVVPVAPGRPGR
jgi:hypothetical protein